MSLWNGEWFENMRSSELGSTASVPYRRETFISKKIVFDFDGDFSMADAASLSNNARGKSLKEINHDVDSLTHTYDSVGRSYYREVMLNSFWLALEKQDSIKGVKKAMEEDCHPDSLFQKMNAEKKVQAVNIALNQVRAQISNLDFKGMITNDGDRNIRQHKIEAINKFTTALSCLIFFFIGAPLGAIIRKGGLGVSVIVSVLVFIIYYILDNTGYRMARGGMWAIWFGKGLSPAVLIPLAAFVTYKATNDSIVFNMDAYKEFFMRLFGLRLKRSIFGKEVIIDDPDYQGDKERLRRISDELVAYSKEHRLVKAPNFIRVFFKYKPDHEIERINEELENIIEDLSNTKDKVVLHAINQYPVISTKAHTRPFERRWLNIIAAIIVPVGLTLYIRMWGFRVRLYRDLKVVRQTNETLINRIETMKL